MHFRKYKNTTEIVFSKKERKLINEKGKVVIDYRDGRHFVNQLAMVVADIHIHYKNNDPNFEKTLSYGEEEVRLKWAFKQYKSMIFGILLEKKDPYVTKNRLSTRY